MKANTIYAFLGAVGSCIAGALGGWSSALATLLIFIIIDYVTGILVATIFTNSPKTENGGVSSKVGFAGIAKKIMIFLIVWVGYRLDLALGVDYIKNAVVIAYIVNELISITENAGLMGVPLPSVITKALELLKEKERTN